MLFERKISVIVAKLSDEKLSLQREISEVQNELHQQAIGKLVLERKISELQMAQAQVQMTLAELSGEKKSEISEIQNELHQQAIGKLVLERKISELQMARAQEKADTTLPQENHRSYCEGSGEGWWYGGSNREEAHS